MRKWLFCLLGISTFADAGNGASSSQKVEESPYDGVFINISNIRTPEQCFSILKDNPNDWLLLWRQNILQQASSDQLLAWATDFQSAQRDKEAFLFISCALSKKDHNASTAHCRLGDCYQWGKGVETDLECAFLQYQHGAYDYNHGESAYRLAEMFEKYRGYNNFYFLSNRTEQYYDENVAHYAALAIFCGYDRAKAEDIFSRTYAKGNLDRAETTQYMDLLNMKLQTLQQKEAMEEEKLLALPILVDTAPILQKKKGPPVKLFLSEKMYMDVSFLETPADYAQLAQKIPQLWRYCWEEKQIMRQGTPKELLEWAASYQEIFPLSVLTWEEREAERKDNDRKAFLLIQQAAQQGYDPALCHLANCYHRGRGVQQSLGKALDLYTSAMRIKDAEAANSLGLMFDQNTSLPGHEDQSMQWYKNQAAHYFALAAYWGHPWGENNFAFLYGTNKIDRENTQNSAELLARKKQTFKEELGD